MKNNLRLTTILFLFTINYTLSTINCFSQGTGIGVNSAGAPADNSSLLDVSATGKGLLLPRMTTAQRPANPSESLIIYNTDIQCFEAYNSATSQWVKIGCIAVAGQCGDSLTDSRDGKKYKTVKIGTQCWLAQNLNYGTRIIGANDQADNSVPEKYCYNNLESNCNIYGGLYQYPEMLNYPDADLAMMTEYGWSASGIHININGTSWNMIAPSFPNEIIQGLCPDGWHVPYQVEWNILFTALGGNNAAGNHLKEVGTSHWQLDSGADNSSGFTGLPNGWRRNFYNDFASLGQYGYIGMADGTTYDTSTKFIDLDLLSAGVSIWPNSGAGGYAVRCVKN